MQFLWNEPLFQRFGKFGDLYASMIWMNEWICINKATKVLWVWIIEILLSLFHIKNESRNFCMQCKSHKPQTVVLCRDLFDWTILVLLSQNVLFWVAAVENTDKPAAPYLLSDIFSNYLVNLVPHSAAKESDNFTEQGWKNTTK